MSPEHLIEMLIGIRAQLQGVADRLREPGERPVGATEAEILIGLRAQVQSLIQHFAVIAEPDPEEKPKRRPTFGRAPE
jgi:hypothetical protein